MTSFRRAGLGFTSCDLDRATRPRSRAIEKSRSYGRSSSGVCPRERLGSRDGFCAGVAYTDEGGPSASLERTLSPS